MTIFSTLSRFAAEYRARRRRLHTYLEVSSLPREIQKDIGWPGAYSPEDRSRRVQHAGR